MERVFCICLPAQGGQARYEPRHHRRDGHHLYIDAYGCGPPWPTALNIYLAHIAC